MERYERLLGDIQVLLEAYKGLPERALVVGRFQHFHLGHYHIVEQALRVAKKVVILVGSAQESGTFKNPFNFELRKELILKSLQDFGDRVEIYPLPDMEDREDQSSNWGMHVLHHLGMATGNSSPDVIINGYEAERVSWYKPEMIPNTLEITVPHAKIDINATQMRQFLVEGDHTKWSKYVAFSPYLAVNRGDWNPKSYYTLLREEILKVPEYLEMGGKQS